MVEEIEKIIGEITGTRPQNTSLLKLKGDASTRSYFRINFIAGGKNSSLIMMKVSEIIPPGISYPFINIHEHLKKNQIPVPEIFFIDHNQGRIFLEDLGDQSLEAEIMADRENIKNYYSQAIDLILKMQTRASRPNNECLAFNLAFDEEKLMFELNFFLTHYIEGLLKKKIGEREREELNKHFFQLAQILSSQKRYFTHRDYHSRNIMVINKQLKLIDFQDARMGPCQYDLVSLLRDSYIYIDEPVFQELLDYYMEEKEKFEGRKIDRPEFRRIFDYMSLQRNLKAIGTFGYQAVIKNNPRYQESIPLTLDYVKINLDKYREFSELRKILLPYVL